MPFSHRNKEVLGGGTAVRQFGYRSTDSMVATCELDYFKHWGELQVNDFLWIVCPDGAFVANVKSRGPTVLGMPENPFEVRKELEEDDINALRAKVKEKGLNSFGKSKEELKAMLAA